MVLWFNILLQQKSAQGRNFLGQSQGLLLLFIPSRAESQTTQEFIANRAYSPTVRGMKLYLSAVCRVQSSFCICLQQLHKVGHYFLPGLKLFEVSTDESSSAFFFFLKGSFSNVLMRQNPARPLLSETLGVCS